MQGFKGCLGWHILAELHLSLTLPPIIPRQPHPHPSNTIVCDGDQEARQLAQGGERRLKVVSAEGTLFKPNGTFQGGRSGNLDARAGRWAVWLGAVWGWRA
jgi:hypothetical protein